MKAKLLWCMCCCNWRKGNKSYCNICATLADGKGIGELGFISKRNFIRFCRLSKTNPLSSVPVVAVIWSCGPVVSVALFLSLSLLLSLSVISVILLSLPSCGLCHCCHPLFLFLLSSCCPVVSIVTVVLLPLSSCYLCHPIVSVVAIVHLFLLSCYLCYCFCMFLSVLLSSYCPIVSDILLSLSLLSSVLFISCHILSSPILSYCFVSSCTVLCCLVILVLSWPQAMWLFDEDIFLAMKASGKTYLTCQNSSLEDRPKNEIPVNRTTLHLVNFHIL